MKKKVIGILLCFNLLLICMGKTGWMVTKALASSEDFVQEEEGELAEEIPFPEDSFAEQAETDPDFLDDGFAAAAGGNSEQKTEPWGLATEEESVFALAPVSLMAEFYADDWNGDIDMEEEPSEYQVVTGDYLDVDEVSKWEVYREIVYVDDQGVQRSSPLYCLQADFHGISGGDIREEAIRTLQDSAIRKLLYFGYGGPGDICEEFDPSCSHIDWRKADNRYIFTHMALTKVYSGQYGDSNEWEYEHCGVNRFLSKILSLTIPARDGMVFTSCSANGVYQTDRKLPVKLTFLRTLPEDWQWVDTSFPGFDDGIQASANMIKVIDTAKSGNGILITRPEYSCWQLGYWTGMEDLKERGQSNPRRLYPGETMELKDGYYFCMAFPKYYAQEELSFPMSFRPVSFLIVDGKIQTGKERIQDFGAYVYQGEQQRVSLLPDPGPSGRLILHKWYSRFYTTVMIPGAEYQLFAAEDIYQNDMLIYRKEELVGTEITDSNGYICWNDLVPGKYYVKESKNPEGFLLDENKYEEWISPGENRLSVSDVPDMRALVEIQKVDADSGETLPGAEFLIYTWNEKRRSYMDGQPMAYDAERSIYTSDQLCYSMDNQGKFRIVETRNPDGYKGGFSQEISLKDLSPGEKKVFSFRVENQRVDAPHVEILKIADDTGEILTGATFQIYPWDQELGEYSKTGIELVFSSADGKYRSGDLVATKNNQGRFLVKETKNPYRYTGNWQQEISLFEEKKSVYEYTVVNNRAEPEYGNISICKTDFDTDEVLEGAEFAVYEWDSGQNCYDKDTPYLMQSRQAYWGYVADRLPITSKNKGKYLVTEIKNPTGYEGSWSKEVVLSTKAYMPAFEVDNHRILGRIFVTKKISAADIVWAQGIPSFLLVAEGTDDRGIYHKWEQSVSFYPDSYDLDANGYASQTVAFDQIPTGCYQIYEKPVLRYYLKSVQAVSENVSVEAKAPPEYGTWPENSFTAEVSLTGENRNASLIFVNEKSRYDGFSHTDIRKNNISVVIQGNAAVPL